MNTLKVLKSETVQMQITKTLGIFWSLQFVLKFSSCSLLSISAIESRYENAINVPKTFKQFWGNVLQSDYNAKPKQKTIEESNKSYEGTTSRLSPNTMLSYNLQHVSRTGAQLNKLQLAIRNVHNLHRENADMGALVYDDQLRKKARELMDNATRNAIFRTCEDENIDLILQQVGVGNAAVLSEIAGVSAIAAVEAVVEGWYSARANYQFPGGNESFDACHENKSISEYSSFTQIMWQNSTHIGCVTKETACGSFFLLCLYEPEGNVQGQALMKDWNFESIRRWGEDISTCNADLEARINGISGLTTSSFLFHGIVVTCVLNYIFASR